MLYLYYLFQNQNELIYTFIAYNFLHCAITFLFHMDFLSFLFLFCVWWTKKNVKLLHFICIKIHNQPGLSILLVRWFCEKINSFYLCIMSEYAPLRRRIYFWYAGFLNFRLFISKLMLSHQEILFLWIPYKR